MAARVEEYFDKMKEKAFQKIIQIREEDVKETKLGYAKIEKRFEELENKFSKLTEIKHRKRVQEKYALIILGALILFVLFVMQMMLFKERDWNIFN